MKDQKGARFQICIVSVHYCRTNFLGGANQIAEWNLTESDLFTWGQTSVVNMSDLVGHVRILNRIFDVWLMFWKSVMSDYRRMHAYNFEYHTTWQ